MKEFSKIVVLAPNKPFFGHILLQVPFFDQLKRKNPNAHISILSPVKHIDILKTLGLCDEVIVYNRKQKIKLFKIVRQQKADQIINLRPYSFAIQLIIGLMIKPHKIGFDSELGAKYFYNRTVSYDTSIYKAQLYLNLLENVPPKPFEYFNNSAKNINIEIKHPYYCLMPGGGEGEHKKWGIENFITMCIELKRVDSNVEFAFIIGPAETAEKDAIEKSEIANNSTIYISPAVTEIAKLTKKCIATIANDCGPSHIPQISNFNYVGLWGWEKQHPIKRMAEWSCASKNSIHIVAEYLQSIKTISPSKIAAIANTFRKN